jgi:hypothetical protein
MTDSRIQNSNHSNTSQNNEETLIAGKPSKVPSYDGGPMGISEESRVKIKYGKTAVPGGEQIPKIEPVFGVSNGFPTVASPVKSTGGDPDTFLYNKILVEKGDSISASVNNRALIDKNSVSGVSISGSPAGIGIGVSVSPGIDRDTARNMETNFNIKFSQEVIKWCDSNKGGAKFKIDDNTTVAYDAEMVRKVRENAKENINKLWNQANTRSDAGGEIQNDQRSTKTASNALEDRNNPLNKVYEQTLAGVKAQGIDGDKAKDVAVALVDDGAKRGFKADSNQLINVMPATNGSGLVAVQGDPNNSSSPTASVNPANVQPNSAVTVAQNLTQTAQNTVAMVDDRQLQPKNMALS